MTDTPGLPAEVDDDLPVTRDNLGRFVKGVTGNATGRPRGARNRASIVREAIEESLQRDLAQNAAQLVDVATGMALDGDKQMLKLLLGEMLKPARTADPSVGKGAPRKVVLNITQNFGRAPEPTQPAIDADFTSEEDSNG